MDDWQKTSSQDLLYNVELLCEAITGAKQVRCKYLHYRADKKLHANGGAKTINPYRIFIKNGHYYLSCSFEPYREETFCRIDRLGEIELLDARVEEPQGQKLGVIQTVNRLPYLFAEEPIAVTFEGNESMIDHIVDWFGYDFFVKPAGEGYSFTVKAGERAMLYWVLQFATAIKVTAPASFVSKVKETIAKMGEMYAGDPS